MKRRQRQLTYHNSSARKDLVASKKTNLTVVVYVVYDNKQLVWGFAHRQCQGWTVAGESEDL
jgi:hypothetical protein